ncbi:MAG: DUF177 domain-containing protein [Blastocatellales bacterium]|nr:DUF177 domain-containing protein [Blastocatellales bacterium]
MIISLVRLPADGRRFEHRYETGELDLGAHEFRLAAAPEVSGRVDRTGMDIRLRGQLRARLLAPCDRCLTDVSFDVDAPFDLFYAPVPADVEAGSETELQERDLGFSFYEGDSIDLDEMVLEQLALALPTRVLCRSDCRGLCDQCGADLNSETCRCAKPMDPRWQALADLRADERDAETNDAETNVDAPREEEK